MVSTSPSAILNGFCESLVRTGTFTKKGSVRNGQGHRKYWAHLTKALREQYKTAFVPETIKGQYLGGEQPGAVGPDGYSLGIYYTNTSGYAEN